MRYRIKNYTTDGQTVMLNDVTLNSIEDLRLVINLTQGIVIYSPMDRSGIAAVMERGFVVETNVCTLNEKTPDQLLIEIDKGDDISSIEKKIEEVKETVENIDLTPIENKVDEGVDSLSTKIDNIKLPEIDTTELAKQGENPEATNSAIYNAVKSLPDLSLLYAARAEKNDDGVNTYSIVLPVTAKVTYDDNGVATIQL